MKKTMIAGVGVGALGLVALPIASTFAATTVTGTVELTVSSAISIASTETINMTAINPGNSTTKNATITVNSNGSTGWNIKAVGSGEYSGDVTAMKGSVANTSIATGTSGDAYWNFKLATSNERITLASGFGSEHAIPATATKVANSTTNMATISNGQITVTYKVKASSTQIAGTYTGKVTYTIAAGTS